LYVFLFTISTRRDSELKDVQNEVRPKGDVRLVTPRGPSASTIEGLEKALQTIGKTCLLRFFLFFAAIYEASSFLRNRKSVSKCEVV
jgi:hypothetical protein